MNFTREPIIETVITPREGCKLVIRSSKGVTQEDYFVDAVEVVSFGHSFFFRSQERPRAFLVPVSDYEVLELKETRMVLKTGNAERSNIKISGGKEPPSRPPREAHPEPSVSRDEALMDSRPAERPLSKREKRRRGRRGRDRDRSEQPSREERPDLSAPMREESSPPPEDLLSAEERDFPVEGGAVPEPKAPSFISKLFPPPPTLIKENLSRYKSSEVVEEEVSREETFEEDIFEPPTKSDKEREDEE